MTLISVIDKTFFLLNRLFLNKDNQRETVMLQQQTKHGAVVAPTVTRSMTGSFVNEPRSMNSELLECLDMVDDVLLTRMVEILQLQTLQTLPDLGKIFRKRKQQYESASRVVPGGRVSQYWRE